MDTQHQSSLFSWGEQLPVPSFEKGGSEKITVWGNLKSFCHAEYLPRGLAIFLVKKKTNKQTNKQTNFQRYNMALSSQFQILISACFSQTIS